MKLGGNLQVAIYVHGHGQCKHRKWCARERHHPSISTPKVDGDGAASSLQRNPKEAPS